MVTERQEQTSALALPEVGIVKAELEAVRAFQRVAQQLLVSGHDFGVIPGTQKPTLLKPGAEKIGKLLGLADTYEITSVVENWDKPFFAYLVRCRLTRFGTDQVVSEGLGECNSYESKYRYRWVFQSELDRLGTTNTGLPYRSIDTQQGPVKQYRIENEDIFTLVNTLLKMAKKRALVDAALSAGRLSDIFTQDMEDKEPPPAGDGEPPAGGPGPAAPLCPEHKKVMAQGKYGWYCKTKVGTGWCKYKPPANTKDGSPSPEQQGQTTEDDIWGPDTPPSGAETPPVKIPPGEQGPRMPWKAGGPLISIAQWGEVLRLGAVAGRKEDEIEKALCQHYGVKSHTELTVAQANDILVSLKATGKPWAE